MIRSLPCLLGAVVVALTGGCGNRVEVPVVAADTTETPDPARIVALGGPVTETLAALGFADAIVAADRSSLWPPAVLERPRLDYFRQTSAEAVLAHRPTLVVAMEGLGPPAVADQLRAAGVPVLLVPEATSVADADARVRLLGRALDREERAEAVAAAMHEELERAEGERPGAAPRALFVYARGAGLVQVFGRATAADGVLALAGAENAVTQFEGTRPLTAEGVVAAAPDVLVIPARGLESIGGVDGLLRQPGLAETPAGRARRVVAVDDALLLGFGPRLGQGVADLARGLRAAMQPEARRLDA